MRWKEKKKFPHKLDCKRFRILFSALLMKSLITLKAKTSRKYETSIYTLRDFQSSQRCAKEQDWYYTSNLRTANFKKQSIAFIVLAHCKQLHFFPLLFRIRDLNFVLVLQSQSLSSICICKTISVLVLLCSSLPNPAFSRSYNIVIQIQYLKKK